MSCWSEVTRWRWHVAVITFLNKHHNFCQNFWRINCPNICIDIELKHPTPSVPLPARWFNVQWRDWQQKTFLSFRQHRNLNNPDICNLSSMWLSKATDCYKSYSHFVIWSTFAVILKFSEKVWIFHFIGFILQKAVLQQNRLGLIFLIIPIFLFRPT